METEKAIERLKRGLEDTMFSTLYSQEQEEEDIKTVLKELEKQEKMIELMLEEMTDCEFEMKCCECTHGCEKDYDSLYACNKQYFEDKANEEAE